MNPSEINLAGWGQQLGSEPCYKGCNPNFTSNKKNTQRTQSSIFHYEDFFPNPHFHNNGQNFC